MRIGNHGWFRAHLVEHGIQWGSDGDIRFIGGTL